MRYYQFLLEGRRCVGVEMEEGRIVNLTRINPNASSTLTLMRAASLAGVSWDKLTMGILSSSSSIEGELYRDDLANLDRMHELDLTLLTPVDAPEVWAFGVTYADSMRERQAESDSPDVYAKVYNADRPESFFKATGARVAPPFGEVGIRADSSWDVPEPELSFVLFGSQIVGYTAGNDMSSRSIEGTNPLYLPQAKVYDKSASFGPSVVSAEAFGDSQNTNISLEIEREGSLVFSDKANTSSMKRSCAELGDWLQRHNSVPDGTVVMTGTGIIPPPEFTLRTGDTVSIEVEKVGRLINQVIQI